MLELVTDQGIEQIGGMAAGALPRLTGMASISPASSFARRPRTVFSGK